MGPRLLEQMLEDEIGVLRTQLGPNSPIAVDRNGSTVHIRFTKGRDGNAGVFKLDCSRFDAEPPSVSMVDAVTSSDLPLERWTPGVPHSIHPITQKPFVCLQGVAEYHSHPSHLDDSWDRYRNRFRIPQLGQRLLDKAGAER